MYCNLLQEMREQHWSKVLKTLRQTKEHDYINNSVQDISQLIK